MEILLFVSSEVVYEMTRTSFDTSIPPAIFGSEQRDWRGGVTEPASLWSISKWHKRVLVELVVGRVVSKDNTLEPPDG